MANEIKKVVEEETGGAVLLELFPNSQLGNEKVLLDAILGGTLDAGLISRVMDFMVHAPPKMIPRNIIHGLSQ